jgi:hypothetical protein
VIERLLKVLAPLTVSKLEALVKLTAPYVNPAPLKAVKEAVVIFIVDDAALTVNPVEERRKPVVPEIVTVDEPRFKALMFVPVDEKAPQVTAKLLVVKVPVNRLMARALAIDIASPRVSVMPAPSMLVVLNDLPAVVRVPVPVNVITPLYV